MLIVKAALVQNYWSHGLTDSQCSAAKNQDIVARNIVNTIADSFFIVCNITEG